MVKDRLRAQTGTAMKSRLQPEIAKEVERGDQGAGAVPQAISNVCGSWEETQQKWSGPLETAA
jgi:hypothetical protein